MCLSVHARPSSFRLACTRSLARRWSEREATERERKREREIKEREGEGETRGRKGDDVRGEK